MAENRAMTREALERDGFAGFQPFRRLWPEGLDIVPPAGGVYAVLRASASEPVFLESNPGGRFKGRDLSVGIDELRRNWVPGAEVVYLGKADDLHRRLREFCRFGAGEPVGHGGGRLIWQLAEAQDLLVVWKRCDPGQDPFDLERELIEAFQEVNGGRMPFANLAGPRRGTTPQATTSRPSSRGVQPGGSPRPTRAERVTLHDEIARILRENGNRWMTTQELAPAVDAAGRYQKRDGSAMTAFQIHARTRNYGHLFERDGSRVRLHE